MTVQEKLHIEKNISHKIQKSDKLQATLVSFM